MQKYKIAMRRRDGSIVIVSGKNRGAIEAREEAERMNNKYQAELVELKGVAFVAMNMNPEG